MTQTITRLYDTYAAALRAVEDLKNYGFVDEQINLVAAPGSQNEGDLPAEASVDQIAAAIEKGGVPAASAVRFAEKVSGGLSLVSIRPPFGLGVKATQIVESVGPVESGIADPVYQRPGFDWAAPFSSLLNLRLLWDDPTPGSNFWNFKVLLDHQGPILSFLKLPELLDAGAPLSTFLNMPTLITDSSPLSKLLRIPTLLSDRD